MGTAPSPNPNSPPRIPSPRPKETSQCTTWADQGETTRERTGAASVAGAMGAGHADNLYGNLWTHLLFSLTLPRTITTPKPHPHHIPSLCTRVITRFSHGEQAMPSEKLTLCFSGGEQWGGGKGHLSQTTNHRNKGNPSAAIIPPFVVTDNATHRQLPTPSPPPLAQRNKPMHHMDRPGGDGEGAN
ncbi:MAG: hypothetical protein GY832_34080 [Chloroflexi bacterium]|nr:hypothetical protein [Chloroflexota bacterium]